MNFRAKICNKTVEEHWRTTLRKHICEKDESQELASFIVDNSAYTQNCLKQSKKIYNE